MSIVEESRTTWTICLIAAGAAWGGPASRTGTRPRAGTSARACAGSDRATGAMGRAYTRGGGVTAWCRAAVALRITTRCTAGPLA
jgi:hypothetical protein